MNITPQFHKTRIAPTPSGFLHLGNVLSFAITATLARRSGASIFLRIDDLDYERIQPQYIQDIFDTLTYLSIPWDEGPLNIQDFEKNYSQIHRMNLYQEALNQLHQQQYIFSCTCSRSQLAQSPNGSYPGTCKEKSFDIHQTPSNWRLLTQSYATVNVKSWPDGKHEKLLPGDMQYFVVKKKDGYPAYQLTSLIDDIHFGIDLIVRGEDLWPSTLAQLHLAEILQSSHYSQITFYHHPLLMGSGQQKLSKSAGDTSIRYLRACGKTPENIYSIIALQLGYESSISNWQQLGDTVLKNMKY